MLPLLLPLPLPFPVGGDFQFPKKGGELREKSEERRIKVFALHFFIVLFIGSVWIVLGVCAI